MDTKKWTAVLWGSSKIALKGLLLNYYCFTTALQEAEYLIDIAKYRQFMEQKRTVEQVNILKRRTKVVVK